MENKEMQGKCPFTGAVSKQAAGGGKKIVIGTNQLKLNILRQNLRYLILMDKTLTMLKHLKVWI
jgi:hypothetical protein